MNKLRSRASADEGFTLVELVISFLILGIIVLPLLGSFVLSIGTTAEANQRTQNSSDAQLLSGYFASDVASSDEVIVSNPLTSAVGSASAPPACGATGDVVVQFDWAAGNTTGGSPTQRYVAYVVARNTAAENDLKFTPIYKLTRVYCENNNGQGPILSSLVLVHGLKSEPKPYCDNALCPVSGAPAAVTPAPTTLALRDPSDTATPKSLIEYGNKSTDPTFKFIVQGTRRVTS